MEQEARQKPLEKPLFVPEPVCSVIQTSLLDAGGALSGDVLVTSAGICKCPQAGF